MMQIQQGVASTLLSLGKIHEELTEFSRRLLREYNFGSEVALVHQILVEPVKKSVEFTSFHRLTVSIGLDFADSKEIEIAARILIEESSCSASVEIRTDPGEAARERNERMITLHEETVDDIELSAAIKFLGKAVKNLDNLADLLESLTERHD
ncbi:hypothetical protein [Streptomyces sp. NPDC058155]|uniref:hypothetical protein n=1 Tax=Streptomyces sp. NPDC058155 TaxID=3346359 RepID=UPI0036E83238